ncbi:MAG: hypothetical protein AAGM67_17260, partial [Bacteroidota bacterium]
MAFAAKGEMALKAIPAANAADAIFCMGLSALSDPIIKRDCVLPLVTEDLKAEHEANRVVKITFLIMYSVLLWMV